MSERLWSRADEFVDFSPCAGNIDFIIEPEKLGRKRTAAVKAICKDCPVRPECINLNVAPVISIELKESLTRPSSSIWVAGEWLPDPDSKKLRAELEEKRQVLIDALPGEYDARPAGVL